MLDANGAHVAALDGSGRVIAANRAWTEHGRAGLGEPFVAADPEASAGVAAVLAGRQPEYTLEYPEHTSTVQRWFQLTVRAVPDFSTPARATVTQVDMTAHKRGALMQAAEWAVMEAAAAGRPLRDLLEIAVRRVEELIPGSIASMMLVDEGGQTLRFGAGPSLPPEYASGLRNIPVGPVCGSCGTAVYRRQPVIVGDIAGDPLWEYPRQKALQSGLKACWSTPVLAADGRPLASVAIYFNEPREPLPVDREWIDRAARLVSLALERDRRERALARINRLYAMLSGVDECIARRPTRQQLFDAICRVAVFQGQFRLATVMSVAEATGELELMSCSGDGREFLADIAANVYDPERDGGTMAAAVRAQKHDVCNRIADDPRLGAWRDRAAARELRSVASFPILSGRRTVGVFTLFAAEADYFQSDEIDLLLAVQNDLSFAIDASEREERRQRTDEQLREQAALLDAAYEAILVKDMTGRIVYWNKGAERAYGWTAEEAIGRLEGELLGVPAARMEEGMRQLAERGEWSGEMAHRAKTGQNIPVDVRWTLVRDAGGAAKSILAFNSDITERKKLELQFLRAQRLESLGTLAGGIAHDLNNLLAPITMGVGLLRLSEQSPTNLDIIDNIEQSAARGAQLVKQVLSFARGVEGARARVDIGRILQEVETIITSTLPKSIRIEMRCPCDLHRVLGDGTQLQQVLLNLCVNARDAMPNGGNLVIAARNVALPESASGASGKGVQIEFCDTGCGIAPEIVDRIFEPFFTTKELGKGTGLGLSTALGIVRSHGGTLSVASSPGNGSRFTVFLPALLEPKESAPAPSAANAPLSRSGRGELVLVVDDERAILGIAGRALESFGYRPLLAQSGADAIGVFAANRHHVRAIISDMMMPGMDGAALISTLRRINGPVPIIAASGLATEEQRDRAVQAGADYFLPKPYSAETLLSELRRALDAAAGHGTIPGRS